MYYNYSITLQPYYQYINQSYINILVLNDEPVGPLKSIVKRLNPPRLSEFKTYSYEYNDRCKRKCIYALCEINNNNEFMCLDDIPNLISFLINNGYTVDTSTTKIMQNSTVKLSNPIICFISYKID